MEIYLHKNEDPINLRETEILLLSRFILLWIIVDEAINFSKEIKLGSHIVNIGYIGLTYFSFIAENEFNIKQIEQENILTPILNNNEAGTLYPKYNWTILPYRYKTSTGYGIEIEEIQKFIDDAFKAELTYIKSGKLIFDFRDIGFEGIRYNNTVYYLATTKYKDLELSVHITSINNKEFISKDELNKYPIGKFKLYESIEKERKERIKKAEEKESKRHNYGRKKLRKRLLSNFRSIKNNLNEIQNKIRIDFKNSTINEKIERIISDENFPPEYFPIEWVDEIIEKIDKLCIENLQQLYNRLSCKVPNKKYRELSKKLKEIEKIE